MLSVRLLCFGGNRRSGRRWKRLYDPCEPEQHENGDNADDYVTDLFQLCVHWHVAEDQRNDEENNKRCDGAHKEGGKEIFIRVFRSRYLVTLFPVRQLLSAGCSWQRRDAGLPRSNQPVFLWMHSPVL